MNAMNSRTHTTAKDTPASGKSAGEERLRKELAVVTAQRREDHARLCQLVQERNMLHQELARRNAEVRKQAGNDVHSDADEPPIEGWQLMPPAVRSIERGEQRVTDTWASRVLATWLLRFARKAAARRDYAQAEIFYQAILQLRPRPFLWRQIGNMLAGQGLFATAIFAFDHAIALAPDDAEAHFVRSNALGKIDRAHEAAESLVRALALNPALRARLET